MSTRTIKLLSVWLGWEISFTLALVSNWAGYVKLAHPTTPFLFTRHVIAIVILTVFVAKAGARGRGK